MVAKDIIPFSDFLGISLNVVSNTKDVGAPMCIFVRKYPSIRGFLSINARIMVIDSRLDQGAYANGCDFNWFTCSLLAMALDQLNTIGFYPTNISSYS